MAYSELIAHNLLVHVGYGEWLTLLRKGTCMILDEMTMPLMRWLQFFSFWWFQKTQFVVLPSVDCSGTLVPHDTIYTDTCMDILACMTLYN